MTADRASTDRNVDGVGGLIKAWALGSYRAPRHVHKKSPWPGPLIIQDEIKCNQVARPRTRCRAGVGGLITAGAIGSNHPRSDAEILAKEIRQIFFLSTNRGRRVGGGRGFKSLRPSAQLPHEVARADFFLRPKLSTINPESKKSKVRVKTTRYSSGWALNALISSIYFHRGVAARVFRKIVAKFGVGGSAGCLIT
jgi:hypothetical protein